MRPRLRVFSIRPAVGFWLVLVIAVGGCALFVRKPPPEEAIAPWDPQSYAAFVRQNIADLNRRYTRDYLPYEFIVDTAKGSTRIQNLINQRAAVEVVQQLQVREKDTAARVAIIRAHLREAYHYVDEPEAWSAAVETHATKRGDCKNLSLWLLSMLLEAGVEAHAAISNGHMWVNALVNGRWQVLETDPNADRTPVYQIPGFYEKPLYKVYPDRTLKRKKQTLAR